MRNIYKHISKYIIAIALVWIGVHIVFVLFGLDMVAAQSATSTALLESVQSKIFWYNSILNALYLIVWPALALAGFALDNSLIYGSFLGMDEPLFLVRNIIKNIANFTLGFMVLFEILKNFFTTGEQGKKAFEVIKKALIAGVLIQASWFLMGAMIDISTIATYSIGRMPISVLNNGSCPDLANTKILPIGANVDFTASNQNNSINNSFQYYYYVKNNDEKTYYSPCEIYDGRWIVGQKYRSGAGNIPYTENYCILPNNMFAYFDPGTQLATNNSAASDVQGLPDILHQTVNDHAQYRSNLEKIINRQTGALRDPNTRSGWLASNIIFDTTKPPFTGGNQPGIYTMSATGSILNPFDSAPKLKTILEKTEGFVGVLITLYKSVLNFVSFNTGSTSTDTMILLFEIGIKVAFGIAMLLPLIVMAVALVIRIGYIWMFIALSPILALQIAFTDDSSIKGLRGSIPLVKDGIGGVLRMIFAPVIIVFAVSFCLIFMTALVSSINNTSTNNNGCIGTQKDFYAALGGAISYTGNTTTYQIANIAEVKQSAFGLDISGPQRDVFGWILINLFGAAIVRLLLFTVIETVFKGTPVGNRKLKETAQNMIGSIPIIPVPDGAGGFTGVGAGTAAKLIEAKTDQISRSMAPAKLSDDILNKNKKGSEGESTVSSTTASASNTIINSIRDDNNKRAAVIGAAATSGLGSAAILQTDGLTDDEKKANVQELSKQILVDDKFYTDFYAKIKGQDNDIKKAAEWINTNKKTLLTKDEFSTLLNRKDNLSNYLAPTADQQVVELSGGNKYTVKFNSANGTYDLDLLGDKDTVATYTMNNSTTRPTYPTSTTNPPAVSQTPGATSTTPPAPSGSGQQSP